MRVILVGVGEGWMLLSCFEAIWWSENVSSEAVAAAY